uniref:tRNA-splicing endonuclease subunit SEN34 n=1 Tax=Arion vulgaris TaxID=1028688 RepID=A0A0B7A9J9_9EUPU
MASDSKSEDEILGLATVDDSKDLSTDNNKTDEDISCIDEDLLLLNSPSESPVPATDITINDLTSPKSVVNVSDISHIHGISDNDDELEIIDDVEEITDLSDSTNLTDDELDEISDDESELESEESNSFLDGKINIFSCHGAFFLWNADDVQMLREECRIVGKLTGSLPRAPRQNSHLGLPLQLMPEEAKLLVDIDAAVVIEESQVSAKTLSIREAALQNVRATNYKIQQKLYKESRKEEVKQRMADIIAGKKAKKQKLKKESKNGQISTSTSNDKLNTKKAGKKRKMAASRDDDEEVQGNKDEDSDDNLTVDDIISETADTSEKHSLVQIFTENPWKRSFHLHNDWAYPSTEREMLRYLVFKDLWGKGFFLTSGAKFGGDFLVYPGDPAKFHSHYIAICKNQLEDLPSLDIITCGRQASNVRKTALLCSVDRSKKVFYTSLQWTGLS